MHKANNKRSIIRRLIKAQEKDIERETTQKGYYKLKIEG